MDGKRILFTAIIKVAVFNFMNTSMKNILEEASCFRCQDMALASACQLFGFPIVAIDRQAGSKSAVFVIERKEGLDDLIGAFWTRELRVDPLSYWEHCRSVKNRLYKDV